MKTTLILAFLLALAGCSMLTEQAARIGATAVAAYCAAESPEARDAYRAAWDRALSTAGHHIEITCNGDEAAAP